MFENDFMKIASSIISTCFEFTQGKADFIFVYIFMDKEQYYFNAFFRFGKETWDVEELEYQADTVEYFNQLIKQDADRLPIIFDEAKREKPVLYKMKFRCKDQKFKFDLKYDKDISNNLHSEQDFYEWKESIKKKNILFF